MPLPGGAAALGVVVGLGSRCATLAFNTFCARVDDEPLALYRWPVAGRVHPFEAPAYPAPESRRIEAPEIVQDRLACARAGATWARPHLAVYDVRGDVTAERLAGLPDDARLQWREALSDVSLHAIAEWFAAHFWAEVRPYGAASNHAPGRALLRASTRRAQSLETHDLARDADVLEGARIERLTVRGNSSAHVDARDIAALQTLRSLHVGGLELRNAEELVGLSGLRALTLRGVRGLRDLTWLEQMAITHLSLEGILNVDDIGPIERMPHLEQLELRGAWQISLDELAWLRDATGLRGLTLDIGGRRKNAEIFKARPRPYFRHWVSDWVRQVRDGAARNAKHQPPVDPLL